MTEEDVEIPRGIALAWGIPASSDRRQKTELSVDRIISVALEIADESGLAAVSMAAVAGRLGYTPMSLYRYVSAKDDLVMLMGDAALGTPPWHVAEAADWRSAVLEWVDAALLLYRRHPWLLDLESTGGVPLTPNAMGWMEVLLGAFRSTDLSIEDVVRAGQVIIAQSRWEGTLARSLADDLEQIRLANQKAVSTLVTEETHPEMARAMRAPTPQESRRKVGFGIARMLDGLAVYIDSPRGSDETY